jgi:PAS domain S-box-containing protein
MERAGFSLAAMTTDRDQNITFMNQAAEELTGWSMDEAQGRPITEVFRLIHESTGEPAPNPCQEVIETGKVAGLGRHAALVSRYGRRRMIEDSAAPIFDAEHAAKGHTPSQDVPAPA